MNHSFEFRERIENLENRLDFQVDALDKLMSEIREVKDVVLSMLDPETGHVETRLKALEEKVK